MGLHSQAQAGIRRSQTFRLAHRLRCAREAPGEFRQGAPRGCRGWQATESPDSKAFLRELVEASFPHSIFAGVIGCGGNTESPAFWVLVVGHRLCRDTSHAAQGCFCGFQESGTSCSLLWCPSAQQVSAEPQGPARCHAESQH